MSELQKRLIISERVPYALEESIQLLLLVPDEVWYAWLLRRSREAA